MEVVHHSSAFLLPSVAPDHRPSLNYALIVLNQRLPRFTPLLWQHEQHSCGSALMEAPTGCLTKCPACSLTKTLLPSETGMISFRYKPDVIKGDMDSVRTDVVDFYIKLGTKVVDASHDQDTTDLHKCVSFICDFTPDLEKSKLCILVAGALGGRFDHEVGNINVLCRFKDTRIILISDDCLIHLLPKAQNHEIHVLSSVVGPHCGLIPIGMPSRSTTTTGLQWDLR
ncbi:thiamine pyrophosphokinase 1-like isoform X3 [Punica granatum]|uniref:thiamine diphosphokinase n=1 Tax=Punica granatum TaxID=22663 RepID=A0A6P8DYG3_PUNGR|nr:thiamine pyrophosphokinase 1-like isoform X3 [Punica granatum]